jgi:hypothetical protein
VRRTLLLLVVVAVLAALILSTSRCRPEPEAMDSSDLEKLQALGYVSEVPTDHAEEGVVVHDPSRALPGLNCFALPGKREAYLMDMEGHPVHTWDLSGAGTATEHVELLEDGDILAVKGLPGGLCRYTWTGAQRWCLDARVHHDVDVDEDTGLYLLVSEPMAVEVDSRTYPILDERVVRATLDGVVLEEVVSLWDIVGERVGRSRWAAIRRYLGEHPEHRESMEAASEGVDRDVVSDSPYDVFHANSIRVVDRDIEGLCRRGDLLLSVRELSLVLIVDPRTKAVRWEFGPGVISHQHDATLLENGRILLFDNGQASRASRVIEVDPFTREIVWSYDGRPDDSFYSVFRGAAQRLPNGNTLITDSGNGRVIEVTPDGQIVWTYYSPMTGPGKRDVLHNVSRIVGERARALEARAADAGEPG